MSRAHGPARLGAGCQAGVVRFAKFVIHRLRLIHAGSVVATLALVGDALRRGSCRIEIGGLFHGLGRFTHAFEEGSPLVLDAGDFLVPGEPVGGRHRAFEVIIRKGEIKVVQLLGVGMHVVDEFCVARNLLCRSLLCRRHGRGRRRRLWFGRGLGDRLLLFGTPRDAQSRSDDQKRMKFHNYPQVNYGLSD